MGKKILIIVAAIVVPFLAMLVLFYFLYPQINEERYKEYLSGIHSEQAEDSVQTDVQYDEIAFDERYGSSYTAEDYENLPNNLELLMAEQNSLQNAIDSLKQEKEMLVSELDDLNSSIDSAQTVEIAAVEENQNEGNRSLLADATDENREEFSERVKSLLNLEEEQLAPIVKQLSDEQLIRLYNSAGNIQREKLLRSLSAGRAAKLMEKIML